MKKKKDKAAMAPAGRTRLGKQLAEQSREKIRDEDAKRSKFARGTRRFTEGK
jgi:hypothetical protein